MVEMTCPNCLNDLLFEDDQRGQEARCSGCNTLLVVQGSRVKRPAKAVAPEPAPPKASKPAAPPEKRPPRRLPTPPKSEEPPPRKRRKSEPVIEVGQDDARPVRRRPKPRITAGTVFLQGVLPVLGAVALGLGLTWLVDWLMGAKEFALFRYVMVPTLLAICLPSAVAAALDWDLFFRRSKESVLASMFDREGMRIILGGAGAVGTVLGLFLAAVPAVIGKPKPPGGIDPFANVGPATPETLDRVLADLRSPDAATQMRALKALQTGGPFEQRRADVVQALLAQANNPELAVRGQAFKALGVWGTADTVPDLLKLLAAADAYNKANVVLALGQLKDERAIPPLTKLLSDPMLRREAVTALRAFGPKAEPAVLPYLNDQDLYLRIDVCRLLKDIGTKESVPALEKASQDKSQLLARAAKEALDAINGRPPAGGPTP